MEMSDEEESAESVQCSDNSDVDSPIPSAVCVEHVSEEDEVASVKSSSTNGSSVSRCKKRVMFESGDNLVLIREIPPRGFYSESDTDTATESDEGSDDKSDEDESDGDHEDRDSLGSEKSYNKCDGKSTAAKGKYDVGKASGKTVAKVAHITGAVTDDVKAENKKTIKKKVLKRSGRKSPTSTESDKPLRTTEKCKNQSKSKQGTRVKLVKKVSDKSDKNSNKTIGQVNNKPKSKFEKRCKSAPPTLERPSHANALHNRDQVNGFYGISNMYSNVIGTTADNRTECVLTADEKLWRLFDCSGTTDRDISARERIIESSDFNSNTYVTHGEIPVKKPSTSSYSNSSCTRGRTDVRAMSATDRRLYSWLMANGNVPNPQQESPSIAPLWESSHSVISENKVVKAPT